MIHDSVTEVMSAACPWLVMVLCLQLVAGWCGLTWRGWRLLVSSGAIALIFLLLPVKGLMIARWVAGVSANFSIPLTGIVAIAVWERTFTRRFFSPADWVTVWSFGAIGGVVLYPLALGASSFDPYEWGWRFSPLFVIIGALTSWLIWKQNRFGFLLLIAAVAFQLRLLESSNYWDYLLDPIYCLVGLVWSCGRLVAHIRGGVGRSTRPAAT